mgnify:CR=1 FL=1
MSRNIHPSTFVHPEAVVHPDAMVGADCMLDNGVKIEAGADLYKKVVVGSGVTIGNDVLVGNEVLIMDGASVCAGPLTERHSSDARKICSGTTIGRDVTLHGEAELGTFAIIPSQSAIAHLGNLGAKKRVVTIYGSELGPRYSIGCQIGVDIDTVEARVDSRASTKAASAETYRPFLPIFRSIGDVVQDAYNQQQDYIDELMELRKLFGLTLPPTIL